METYAMPQLQPANTSRLFSISGTFGDAQIVATASRVLIDLQTRNYDANGDLRKHHALADLPLEMASSIHDLLGKAIAAAADAPEHQPGLWSEATAAHTALRLQKVRRSVPGRSVSGRNRNNSSRTDSRSGTGVYGGNAV
jgi:hypothetical protein